MDPDLEQRLLSLDHIRPVCSLQLHLQIKHWEPQEHAAAAQASLAIELSPVWLSELHKGAPKQAAQAAGDGAQLAWGTPPASTAVVPQGIPAQPPPPNRFNYYRSAPHLGPSS